MINNIIWEKSTIPKICEIFDELLKYYVWIIPMEKSKNENWQIICFDEWWKYFFDGPLSTYGILFIYPKQRKLSWAIKYCFAFLQRVNNSIDTKLYMHSINNCNLFLKNNSAWHISMNKLCCAFLKYEN